jgi:lipid-A-disaccharide synthase
VTKDNPAPPFRLPPPRDGGVDLLIIAGEHSGDQHAARLVGELLAKRPGLKICAMGGPRLAAAGAQLLHDLTTSSVIGPVEVLKKYYSFFRPFFHETVRWLDEHRPRAVCSVDYGGFNIRLAGALRERGLSVKGGGKIKMLYYISPQIWASRAGRRFALARNFDALAVIFPFELKSYADTPLPVEFVGHPFVAADYVSPVRYDPAGPILLLPGSRRSAVARIFPTLLAGFAEFSRENADQRAVVLYPSDEILAGLRALHPPANVRLQPAGPPVAASAVLMSSGTASMHCALAGIPGAITYRTDPLTYWLGRLIVKVPYLGLANLLLNEPMYPEFIQGAATAENLARELAACVREPARREKTAEQAARLRKILQQPSNGTADWLLRQLVGV